MTLEARINSQLSQLNLAQLNSEQLECLKDPDRITEAAAMLDDLAVRCGLRLDLPEAIELATYGDEGEARRDAEDQAHKFDAVCIEELATDDSRSNGGNEYRVLAFKGPDGVLAATLNQAAITCWIAGREQD
jgi:hypothetical protein